MLRHLAKLGVQDFRQGLQKLVDLKDALRLMLTGPLTAATGLQHDKVGCCTPLRDPFCEELAHIKLQRLCCIASHLSLRSMPALLPMYDLPLCRILQVFWTMLCCQNTQYYLATGQPHVIIASNLGC